MHRTMVLKRASKGQLFVREWLPEGEIIGRIHLLHGMAEHSLRYKEFGEFLADKGYVVWAHDHRQHGHSIDHHSKGIFGQDDTWENMIEDVVLVQKDFQKKFPGIPSHLLGHSMGSVILRDYLQSSGAKHSSAILTGTPSYNKKLLKMGRLLAWLLSKVHYYKVSPLMNQLSLGAFNKGIINPLTPFDWISKDQERVRHYATDDLCGYAYNPRFYGELSKGMMRANTKTLMAQFPKVPMLIMSGEEDPAGDFGKGVTAITTIYKDLGVANKLKLIKNMRHEILNEVNREVVYGFTLSFMHLPKCNRSDKGIEQ